jgi:hypothetical protein
MGRDNQMKTISKTDWARTHSDDRKIENGQHFIIGYKFDNSGSTTKILSSDWIPVKIKGLK